MFKHIPSHPHAHGPGPPVWFTANAQLFTDPCVTFALISPSAQTALPSTVPLTDSSSTRLASQIERSKVLPPRPLQLHFFFFCLKLSPLSFHKIRFLTSFKVCSKVSSSERPPLPCVFLRTVPTPTRPYFVLRRRSRLPFSVRARGIYVRVELFRPPFLLVVSGT